MQDRARGGKTQSACAYAFLNDARHFGDVVVRRHSSGRFAVAQHISAHCTVRDMRADIDGARHPFQLVEIFGETFPVPRHPLGQCRAGNILNPFHQADQPFAAFGLSRGEANAAIAHHDSGNTVPARWSHFGVPCSLPIIMGMDVNKAGGDNFAAGIDLFAALRRNAADRSNQPAVDGDIACETGFARTIDNRAAANDQIMHVPTLLCQITE